MVDQLKIDFWNNALSSDFTYLQFSDSQIKKYIEKKYIQSPVLDYGFGKEELIQQLLDNDLVVSGIDISNVGVDIVNRLVGGKVLLKQGDYKNIEGIYKTIIMKLVYAFVDDKRECLRAIHNHLEPGGKLVLLTPVINETNRDTVTKPKICVSDEDCKILYEEFSSVDLISEIDKPTGIQRIYICTK